MDATMLMASLTGISVIGILIITLKDCWTNPMDFLKLEMVKLKN
jgi:hypothetical protein